MEDIDPINTSNDFLPACVSEGHLFLPNPNGTWTRYDKNGRQVGEPYCRQRPKRWSELDPDLNQKFEYLKPFLRDDVDQQEDESRIDPRQAQQEWLKTHYPTGQRRERPNQ